MFDAGVEPLHHCGKINRTSRGESARGRPSGYRNSEAAWTNHQGRSVRSHSKSRFPHTAIGIAGMYRYRCPSRHVGPWMDRELAQAARDSSHRQDVDSRRAPNHCRVGLSRPRSRRIRSTSRTHCALSQCRVARRLPAGDAGERGAPAAWAPRVEQMHRHRRAAQSGEASRSLPRDGSRSRIH